MIKINVWKYWRPIYKYTWAVWQKSSYGHYIDFLSSLNGEKKILDVGSGTGEYLKSLPYRGDVQIYITDPDSDSLKLAVENASHLSESLLHQCCGVDDALYLCKAPNVISYVHVLSVIDNPHAYIAKSKEVLAEGGTILVYLSKFNGVTWLDVVSKIFGFRQLMVDDVLKGFDRKSVGLMNYCYIYRG